MPQKHEPGPLEKKSQDEINFKQPRDEQLKPVSIWTRLSYIQRHLNAPKSRYNKFGKYYYRSCEDILNAVKGLLGEDEALIVTDDIIPMGQGRFYVRAEARFLKQGAPVTSVAYAREPDQKKGMDEAQITGATSSYARKYALNGLFAIDDTKDPDSDEHGNQSSSASSHTKSPQKSLEAVLGKPITQASDDELKSIKTKIQTKYGNNIPAPTRSILTLINNHLKKEN